MDWFEELLKPEIIWFLIGLFLVLSELAVPGVVIVFFGVGAWITAVVCWCTDISINLQLGIFIASSVLSLITVRTWIKGTFLGHVKGKQDLREELEEFVGKRAVVTEGITPKLGGKVEFNGTNWMAEAEEEIAAGEVVEIVEKDNITFKVKAV